MNKWNCFFYLGWIFSKIPNPQLKKGCIYPTSVRPSTGGSDLGWLGSWQGERDTWGHTEKSSSWATCFSPRAPVGADMTGWHSCLLPEKPSLSIPLNVPGMQTTQYSMIKEPALFFLSSRQKLAIWGFFIAFHNPQTIRRQISNLTAQTLGVTP